MSQADQQYIELAKRILKEGEVKEDRTGTGTISLFGPQMEFDLKEGFPLLTTKNVPFRIVAEELLWFVRGDTNLKSLIDKNVKIWNPDGYRWYKEQGGTLNYENFIEMVKKDGFDLGPIYAHQWRSWQKSDKVYIDQLQNVIDSLRYDQDSRRHIVSAWNPSDLSDMALPPCHILMQFYVSKGELSCKLYMRSNDFFLGAPFNIASYALLTHMIAKMTGLGVGKFIHTIGDAHIYLNHVEQVKEQCRRTPKNAPTLHIETVKEYIEDYTTDDFKLEGYNPHPRIQGDVSVGLKNLEEDSKND